MSEATNKTRDGSAYLKNASTRTVVDAVKHVGSIAFLAGGLTNHDIAASLSQAIHDLDADNLRLSAFFVHGLLRDDSYESVTYELSEHHRDSQMTSVTLQRVIKYKQEYGNRKPDIVHGPMVPRAIAEQLCDLLNAFNKRQRDE